MCIHSGSGNRSWSYEVSKLSRTGYAAHIDYFYQLNQQLQVNICSVNALPIH
jgi:hypothetical protein